MRFKFWMWIDSLLHKRDRHWGWVCDRVDLAIGMTRTELRRIKTEARKERS